MISSACSSVTRCPSWAWRVWRTSRCRTDRGPGCGHAHEPLISREVWQKACANRRAEHAAILAQIKQKEAAIERYFTAFENGTMDDETAGDRLKKLRSEIAQLTARADELNDMMTGEPTPPPPGTLERLQAYLADAITNGTANERKAAIEALIAEIRITDEGVIPVFRISGPACRSRPATAPPPSPEPNRFARWCGQ